jgi:hypothetical protein
MRQCVELFSKLRINQLYLVVDTDEEPEELVNTALAAKMYALDEVCRRHFVDLVPTIIISTANQSISLDLLRNFSQKTIALFLQFEKGQCSDTACYDVCQGAISTIAMAGFRSIILSCTSFVSTTVNPVLIANYFDLTVVSYNTDDLLNPSLFAKPLLCTQTLLGLLSNSAALTKERGQTVNILPAVLDSDFMYPLLFTKLVSYLHGGFAWNRAGICDMLGDFKSSKILRETMSQFIFGQASEDVSDLLSSALDLLTTQRYTDDSNTADIVVSSPSSASNTQGKFSMSAFD